MSDEMRAGQDEEIGRQIEVTITDSMGLSDSGQYKQEGPGGPHFEWTSYIDLLEKARRDLVDLRKAVSSDGLFNFLASTAHVYDWVIKDPAATRPLIDDANQLVYGDPPSAVAIVYRLCNKAKHMNLTRSKQPPPTTVRREGSLAQAWGTSPWGGGITYQAEVNGVLRDVLDVGEDAIGEWDRLLANHGMPAHH